MPLEKRFSEEKWMAISLVWKNGITLFYNYFCFIINPFFLFLRLKNKNNLFILI